jgi:hypothetical protein
MIDPLVEGDDINDLNYVQVVDYINAYSIDDIPVIHKILRILTAGTWVLLPSKKGSNLVVSHKDQDHYSIEEQENTGAS